MGLVHCQCVCSSEVAFLSVKTMSLGWKTHDFFVRSVTTRSSRLSHHRDEQYSGLKLKFWLRYPFNLSARGEVNDGALSVEEKATAGEYLVRPIKSLKRLLGHLW